MPQRPNRPTQIINLPSFVKAATAGNRFIQMTLDDLTDTNVLSTSSFRYDPRGEPLKSTQQLNVDWSKFENHTFFMPAEVKVNVAFDTIINGFPFDGSQKEVEDFFDRLTGFEKWVYDQFPKNRGYLHFNGDLENYITLSDNGGGLYPELSRPRTGASVLNPGLSSFSIEGHIKVPDESNSSNQVVFQKHDPTTRMGFTLYLSPGGSTTCDLNMVVSSGSISSHAWMPLTKGKFTHFVADVDRDSGPCKIRMYSEGNVLGSSRTSPMIGHMPIDLSPFTLGSGSAWYVTGTLTTPTQTLSASIDDFRLFHARRSIDAQQLYATRGVNASSDLKLYYRFNEPDGNLVPDPADAVNSLVLDHSGNSLHAVIQNFTSSLRISYDDDPSGPMSAERDELSPILFPAFGSIVGLNEELLMSASLYDDANPNLITRLVPKHYLLEGQQQDGLNSLQGEITDAYGTNASTSGIPGSGQLGSTQIMLTFLYMYAKMFDELKTYIDQFGNVNHASYSPHESTPDTFLYSLAQQFGFELPALFNEATIEQYVNGDNITGGVSSDLLSLREVQDEMMKRIIVNLPKIIKSKGTLYSVKAFMRAVGIDPDNSVRIREYGGPSEQSLAHAREKRFEPGVMAQFYTSSLVISPYLSASRLEPGSPDPMGQFVATTLFPPNGISNNRSDGLLTSASWTWEGTYRWTPAAMASRDWQSTQSLVRLAVTGTNASFGGVIANLVASSGSNECDINLYIRPSMEVSASVHQLTLHIPSGSIFDNDRWGVSFGCVASPESGGSVSSSYFIRAGKAELGELVQYHTTSSYFYEGTRNALRLHNTSSNTSGTFIVLGQAHQIISGTTGGDTGHLYLNNSTFVSSAARTTSFMGRVAAGRFWSKALTDAEWREHVKNYKSAGVDDPLTNYNFNKTSSGSWNRLRLETFMQQDERQPLATGSGGIPLGGIVFLDVSQNGLHMTGSGFPLYTNVMSGETFEVGYLSPNFDEGSSTEKVRVRGYQSLDLLKERPWADLAPVYHVRRSEKPMDDTRFVIEFSLIDALNRDIITMFSSFNILEDALGAPENMFSGEYPKLRRLSDTYFNRLTEKLNFRAFFEFYRWFDTAIGTFIEQLIPRKTNFRGVNFTIESHMLERHKVEYFFNEMYLAQDERQKIRDVLLLQQIAGSARKY